MTETVPQLQPLYLLADSQLLFWKRQDRLLLEAAVDGLARDTRLSAAYIGASNGDHPEFYRIFEAAVDAIGSIDRRMIDSSFSSDDRSFLERAQLIVLAGGDVRLGWNTFEKTGMKDVILSRPRRRNVSTVVVTRVEDFDPAQPRCGLGPVRRTQRQGSAEVTIKHQPRPSPDRICMVSRAVGGPSLRWVNSSGGGTPGMQMRFPPRSPRSAVRRTAPATMCPPP
ncbi:MAG: hypothetical protein ACRDT5_14150 [Mycobacterium sp.]